MIYTINRDARQIVDIASLLTKICPRDGARSARYVIVFL